MMNRYEKRKPMPQVDAFDYKDIETLQRFLSPQGRIHSRKRTGLNARKQRELKLAIKTARFLALMPYDNR